MICQPPTSPTSPHAAGRSHQVAPVKKIPGPVTFPPNFFRPKPARATIFFARPQFSTFFFLALIATPAPSINTPAPPFPHIPPDGKDCKSPALPPPSEKSPGQIPEKFGSGNGANATGNSSFKSPFSKNKRFNRKKTVQNRSVTKCAKTGQPNACHGIRHPPDDRYCPKIKGVLSAPENRSLFPEKRGDPGAGGAGMAPGGGRNGGHRPDVPLDVIG